MDARPKLLNTAQKSVSQLATCGPGLRMLYKYITKFREGAMKKVCSIYLFIGSILCVSTGYAVRISAIFTNTPKPHQAIDIKLYPHDVPTPIANFELRKIEPNERISLDENFREFTGSEIFRFVNYNKNTTQTIQAQKCSGQIPKNAEAIQLRFSPRSVGGDTIFECSINIKTK